MEDVPHPHPRDHLRWLAETGYGSLQMVRTHGGSPDRCPQTAAIP